ncbi:MAG TPA: TolC family outer membrane protein [Gammaproteobacteria bacterium]|jgi:TolC family type I secretion outer membrane protein
MSNNVTQRAVRIALYAMTGLGFSAATNAATLEDALTQAWQNNPTLAAERESLAAAQNRVEEAQGGYYPQVKLFGGLGTSHNDVAFMAIPGFALPLDEFSLNTRQVGIEADQVLYAGGKVTGTVDIAKHMQDAEEAHMHGVEQGVLLDAAQSYMAVLEAQAVLALEQSNENVLKQALDAAQANFDNGEVTHTDVDQAKARLAGTQAARIQADGAVTAAIANYERIIGSEPADLQQPAALTGLPASQQDAMGLAEHNFAVVSAEAQSAAAESNVDVAESSMKPNLTLTAQVSKANEPQFLFERLDTRSIMLNLSVPLYAGGSLTSQMHAAKHEAMSSEQQALDARRQAKDQVIQAWQAYQTATAGLAAIQVEITAAQSAYDGVQAEYKQGERTTLDVLNAEQELLNAKVNQVKAQSDETVAEYSLKAATGSLTADDLHLKVQKPADDTAASE